MAVTTTARLGMTQWSSAADPPVTRAQLNDDNLTVEQKAAGGLQGNAADRPAAGAAFARFFYWAEDTEELSWCDGAEWVTVATSLAAYLLKAGGTLTGDIDFDGNEAQNPTVVQAVDKLVANATATGTVTIDGALGQRYRLTATGNVTLAWSNIPDGAAVRIIFIQDATGGRTLTFPASTLFRQGVAPAVSTTPNARTELVVSRDGSSYLVHDGGTDWAAL